MKESERLNFLKSYLKLFGVENIQLLDETIDSIRGIAIYDKNDPEEHQEFIWYKNENEIPSQELKILIEKIVSEKWHIGDKIYIELLELEEFDNLTREEILSELFKIQIRMVDDGEETDSYYLHL